jgi:hypothetical protein
MCRVSEEGMPPSVVEVIVRLVVRMNRFRADNEG